APSTRWIENLVKPVTVWMERKIQTDRSQRKEPGHAPNNTPEDGNVGAPESSPKLSEAVSPEDIISVAQASAIATAVTPGNVLRVKLLERENERPKYRVKLISTRGEIHIVHIDAVTQELILPAGSKEKL
ncbi:MAG: PepSY domain-containing protein, partial [Halioglobus sp.]